MKHAADVNNLAHPNRKDVWEEQGVFYLGQYTDEHGQVVDLGMAEGFIEPVGYIIRGDDPQKDSIGFCVNLDKIVKSEGETATMGRFYENHNRLAMLECGKRAMEHYPELF